MTQKRSALSISDHFKRAFSRQPNKIAVKSGMRAYTFGELDGVSGRIGKCVYEHLGDSSAPLAIFLQDPIDIIPAIIGAMRSGYSYSVLSEKNPSAYLSSILVDLEAKLLLTDSALLPIARLAAPPGCTVLNISDIHLNHNETFYRQIPAGDTAGIYYTSGSTGEPKGVMRLHSVIVDRYQGEMALYKMGPDDVLCIPSSFSSSASLNFFSAFFSGGTNVICQIDRYGFSEMKRILLDERVRVFHCPAQPLRQFLASIGPGDVFPDLRLVIPFGDVIYQRDIDDLRAHILPDADILVTFSSSEIGVMAFNLVKPDISFINGRLLAGRPVVDKDILLLDENELEVPAGEVGEIVVRTDQPFHGYWRRPELTAEKLMPDPLDPSRTIFCSGDMGRFLPDGQLEHLGRKDFRVKIRGFSVDLLAIENELMSNEKVQQAVVVAREDPSGEKRLVAYVLPVGDSQITVKELHNTVSANLPNYMVPALFMIVSGFPLGVTGKVNRALLSVPLWGEIDVFSPFEAPVDVLEAKLAAIWKKVLKIQQVGVNDNFFELGGDSLMTMSLFLEIEREFAQKIPLTVILRASTIRQQAEILLRNDNMPVASVIPVKVSGAKPPVFWIPSGFGVDLYVQGMAKYFDADQPLYLLSTPDAPSDHIFLVEEMAKIYAERILQNFPDGPYYLVGHSAGGTLACATADELMRSGGQVGWVGVLDTAPPQTPSLTVFESFELFIRNISPLGFLRSVKDLYRNLFVFTSMAVLKIESIRSNVLKMRKISMVKYFGPRESAYVKVFFAHSLYKPEQYSFNLIVFRANGVRRYRVKDFLPHWSNYAGKGLKYIDVPGDHVTIMDDANIGVLAGKMCEQIAR